MGKHTYRIVIALAAAALGQNAGLPAAHAQVGTPGPETVECTFAFAGDLHAVLQTGDFGGSVGAIQHGPLGRVQVKIEYWDSGGWGGWEDAALARANPNGRFEIEFSLESDSDDIAAPCNAPSGIDIRVSVRFEDDELRVKPTDWYVIFDSTDDGNAPIVDLVPGYAYEIDDVVGGYYWPRRADSLDELESLGYDLSNEFLFAFVQDNPGTETDEFEDAKLSSPGNPDLLDMGSWQACEHAAIWLVAKDMIDYMDGLGSDIAFDDKLKIKYPHNSALVRDAIDGVQNESSYASPVNHVVYIFRSEDEGFDELTYSSLYHELMHIWAYDHDHGTTGLMAELFWEGETHGWSDREGVAFNEGFAEHSALQLEQALNGADRSWQLRPFSRAHIATEFFADDGPFAGRPIFNLQMMDNYDDCWLSILNVLTSGSMSKFDFGSVEWQMEDGYLSDPFAFEWPATWGGDRADNDRFFDDGFGLTLDHECAIDNWVITFPDLLRVFVGNGDVEPISSSDVTLEAFLVRVKRVLDELSTQHVDAILEILDPQSDRQPHEIMSCELSP